MPFTIPNILTFFRLLAAPSVGIILITDLSASFAMAIFLLASITDYFDGYLARVLNQSTSFGKMLDPIADKAMVIIALCFIPYSFESSVIQILFGLPATAIIFREIFISGLREYVGVQTDLLLVTKLSKWKTALQMISVGVLLASNVESFSHLPLQSIGLIILWLGGIVTVITGLDYFKKSLKDLKG